jgi:hypothetical protein
MNSPLLEFFDRVYIINLPERVDRYDEIREELGMIGIAIDDPKVTIMHGQWSESANGFSSLGAYGNFMSHLRILRDARSRGLRNVWIMEDDAIFRRQARSVELQSRIVARLREGAWDLCYLGHRISAARLKSLPGSLLAPFPANEEFLWAHCYAVSEHGLGPLLAYLEETLVNPPGHPRGGRMYIDGALNMFRRFHPQAVTWVSTPNLSGQRGSKSSLAQHRPYDGIALLQPIVRRMRRLRDEIWRQGMLN